MNYNILAYGIFLSTMIFIIVYVGRLFYRNGRVFILALFRGDAVQTDHMNQLLLVAYYLFNIGYAFVELRFWDKIVNVAQLVSSLASNVGLLVFILAVTHYFNMALIYFLSKRHSTIIHS